MAKENLHRRTAITLKPATVLADAVSMTIVVPEVVGKNSSHTGGRKGQRFTSKHTNAFRKSVLLGTQPLHVSALFEHLFAKEEPGPLIHSGAWRLEVIGVWPTQNHDVGFVAPRGDADAAIPQALDALQYAGILDDDARVVEVRAWNLYRKGVRATVMRLVRVKAVSSIDSELPMDERFTERDDAIAHLLPFVPPAVEPPSKPAKKRGKKVKP